MVAQTELQLAVDNTKASEAPRVPLRWRVVEPVVIFFFLCLFWLASWGTLWEDEENESDDY